MGAACCQLSRGKPELLPRAGKARRMRDQGPPLKPTRARLSVSRLRTISPHPPSLPSMPTTPSIVICKVSWDRGPWLGIWRELREECGV